MKRFEFTRVNIQTDVLKTTKMPTFAWLFIRPSTLTVCFGLESRHLTPALTFGIYSEIDRSVFGNGIEKETSFKMNHKWFKFSIFFYWPLIYQFQRCSPSSYAWTQVGRNMWLRASFHGSSQPKNHNWWFKTYKTYSNIDSSACCSLLSRIQYYRYGYNERKNEGSQGQNNFRFGFT